MLLYLRDDLLKSSKEESAKPAAAASRTGQQRGGKYVARVQVGYEKDGSPKYRYFKTEQEYEAYLKDSKSEGKNVRRGHVKGSGELEDKVKKEHVESTKKQHRSGLLVPERRISVKKGINLFVRI